jgi:hypothetical protein
MRTLAVWLVSCADTFCTKVWSTKRTMRARCWRTVFKAMKSSCFSTLLKVVDLVVSYSVGHILDSIVQGDKTAQPSRVLDQHVSFLCHVVDILHIYRYASCGYPCDTHSGSAGRVSWDGGAKEERLKLCGETGPRI